MLKIDKLVKAYQFGRETVPVLHQISLEVPKGKIFGFLGANGAGKTTTIKVIVGLLFPDKGTITIDGLPHSSTEAKKIIGFMPEQPQFYHHLSAYEVLLFVGELFEIEPKLAKTKAKNLLKLVGLSEAENTIVRRFSKGMHQRLAFAVALMNDPKLLIMDEPLDGLDPLGRLDFKRLFLEQKKLGTTIFLSSHILSDIEEICDEVAIIDRGRIIKQADPKKLLGKHRTLEEYFVSAVQKR
jgi:ABC-2 type transport system ATP-binding protein